MLGENAKAEQNFQRALAARAAGLRDPPQLGLVSLQQRPRRASRSRNSSMALRNPLYKTPEIALDQRRTLQRRVRRHRGRRAFFRRALARSPDNAHRRVRARAARVPAGRCDEARGWMRRLTQQPAPAPEALYLGMCIETQGAATAPPRRRTSRSCATAIRTRPRRKAVADRGSASDRAAPSAAAASGDARRAADAPARCCAPAREAVGTVDRRRRAAAEARAAPGARARGRRLHAPAGPHVRARLRAQLRAARAPRSGRGARRAAGRRRGAGARSADAAHDRPDDGRAADDRALEAAAGRAGRSR